MNSTFSLMVWNTAPFNERRPPATSHLVPTSKLDDSCGSTFGLFWLLGAALSVKFAAPGGVTVVPYET